MPSRNDAARETLTAEAFALALVLAASLQIMENLIPRFPLFPWLKLGLSYVVILPFLLRYGAMSAFALVIGRNVLGVLYGGQIFTTFLISSGSGLLAFLLLGAPVAWAYRRGALGLVGVSVLLATAFNLSQLAIVEWALIRHSGFFFQMGPLLVWSVVSGAGVAWLVRLTEGELRAAFAHDASERDARATRPDDASVADPLPMGHPAKFVAGLFLLAAILWTSSMPAQALLFPLLLFLARKRAKLLGSTWPLLVFLAWLHAFHTPGRYVQFGGAGFGGMTHEGLAAFAFHALRLFNLVLLGQRLAASLPLAWLSRSSRPYVRGFVLAIPALPGLFALSLSAGRAFVKKRMAGERASLLAPILDAWRAQRG